MSGKRRRALYKQCKAKLGGPPSRQLFWVDGKGVPGGSVSLAGNVFRAWKKSSHRILAVATSTMPSARAPKERSGRRRLQMFVSCTRCFMKFVRTAATIAPGDLCPACNLPWAPFLK